MNHFYDLPEELQCRCCFYAAKIITENHFKRILAAKIIQKCWRVSLVPILPVRQPGQMHGW
tara:strand:+ start:254 stop:436 length:183 start_codon:yes stop_codon:yes gene_type:complete